MQVDQNLVMWCCCGLGVILFVIIICMLFSMNKKKERYIDYFDKRKCENNSKDALSMHCDRLLKKVQLPMLQGPNYSDQDRKDFSQKFLEACDHTETLKQLCKTESNREMLKKLIDNTKELAYSAGEYAESAKKLREKMEKDNKQFLDTFFGAFGL